MAGHAWLEQHRDAIDALNVFPVPDGDTGRNMAATMRAATKEIAALDDTSAAAVAEKLWRGALMGARGNSGVILSQILRGIAQGLVEKPSFTPADLAAALGESSTLAYKAVIKPVEGTILTVVRESADAAQAEAAKGCDMPTLLGAVVTAAKAAVAKTPDLLPTLKQAGVVDAGGQGLTTIFEGMWRYSIGESVQLSQSELRDESETHRGNVTIEEEFGYEVVFMLHGEDLDIEKIRDTITSMGGTSTVVGGDATLLKVHTHTATPGKILDYGVGLGSLQDINIENLQEQSIRYAAEGARERGLANGATAQSTGAGTAVGAPPNIPTAAPLAGDIGTVAVATGDGWVKLFQSFGAQIVPGGQTMNPSTQDILAAVEASPAQSVIILPNNGNVVMSARQVEGLTKKRVHVVPTDTLPQGVSALLALNFEADFDSNVQAMDSAKDGVQTAEVTRAVRSVQIDGVSIQEGDVIALVNGKLVSAGSAMETVLHEALGRMQADQREIITVYYGSDVTADEAQTMADRIKEWFPGQEVEVHEGGQPYYDYIVSAE